ncbi:Fcf1-domain-containing protein, partial [Cunninghamella echinulata]
MRPKTQRLYKKAMHSYTIGFGFRTPYQILLDSTFCKLATDQRIKLNDELQTVLSSPTRPMTTECTINELRKTGDHGAVHTAKQFEIRKCKHRNPVSSEKCTLELVGAKNEKRFCIATQNENVIRQLHDIPGVPILKLKNGLVILESLTNKTKQVIQKNELTKTLPTQKEAEHLKIAKMIQPPPSEPVHKRRKAKGPNPLSMKKKKKQQP